jgi:diguanylate cyclase (GGDEF)-like protein
MQARVREQLANIDALVATAMRLRFTNAAEAIPLLEEARLLSCTGLFEGKPYEKGLAASLSGLATMKIEIGDYIESIPLLHQAHEIYKQLDDRAGLAAIYNDFGRIYMYLGDYTEALQYHQKTLDLARACDDKNRLGGAYNNIGYIHLRTQNYPLALEYCNKSLAVFNAINFYPGLAYANQYIGEAYYHLKDFAKALDFNLRSLELSNMYGIKTNQADAWNTLADIYEALGEGQQAVDCLRNAFDVAQSRQVKSDMVEAQRRLGLTYIRQRQNGLALAYLHQALDEAGEIQSKKLQLECHAALAEAYKQSGDFQHALQHHELYHAIHLTLFNENADTRLKTLEVIHQVEVAQKEAEVTRHLNTVLQQEIEERKKVQATLEELAHKDSLTGLLNRRSFFEASEREYARSRRYNTPLSVILFDIDHFKQVNDRFGHQAGDHTLVKLANHLNAALRKVDLTCRYGGEEFIILLPETGLDQACQAAERLRQEVLKLRIRSEKGIVTITISLGVAELLKSCPSLDQFFYQADCALYQAKQAGRNRVMMIKTTK